MKASQLIAELQKKIEEHGDLEVSSFDDGGDHLAISVIEKADEEIWFPPSLDLNDEKFGRYTRTLSPSPHFNIS